MIPTPFTTYLTTTIFNSVSTQFAATLPHTTPQQEKETQMTQEQKRIAIAEACGWRLFSQVKNLWAPPRCVVEYDCDAYPLPNYLNDLNAMHEAENVLFPTHEADWHLNLARVCGHSWRIMLTSTASQRAEAFGLTLGLWK
jgi:hypothetical protein